MTAAELAARILQLLGDPTRDPFVSGVDFLNRPIPAKALFRLVPQRSGTIYKLAVQMVKGQPESNIIGTVLPLAIVRAEPCEILAPTGWLVAAMVNTGDGNLWGMPFAEVQASG